jgi:hypothetical protein
MLKKSDLIPSVPLPMDKTISIRVVRQFYHKGALQEVGSTLDYPQHLAIEAIALGKAERMPVESSSPDYKLNDADREVVKDEAAATTRSKTKRAKE